MISAEEKHKRIKEIRAGGWEVLEKVVILNRMARKVSLRR